VSHLNCDKVQDAYSLLCIPQVHGACRDEIPARNRSGINRGGPMTSSRLKAVRGRAMTQADAHEVSELEAEVWGDAGATPSMLRARLRNYPEGNLPAVATDGTVCGYAAFCLLNYEEYKQRGATTWYDLSGNGSASTHVDHGPDLVGINLSVPRRRAGGVSSRLLEAVIIRGTARRCRRGPLGARLPSYHKHADKLCALLCVRTTPFRPPS
jgi:hypothetical protein